MLETTESPLDRALSVFLSDRSGLKNSDKQLFERVVRSLSRALREGHICIELDQDEQAVMTSSRIVSEQPDMPLVLSGPRLYLARYFNYESRLVERLHNLASLSYDIPDLDTLLDQSFPPLSTGQDLQRSAASLSLSKPLSIIAGGPGTGKTTTVARIVGLLLALFGSDLRIALAAPTGKAAIRMRESISRLIPRLPFTDEVRDAFPREAVTLHRLLGTRYLGAGFKHNSNNPLPWDVVLVDEASMVDMAMMSRLVDALKENSRLILLGDKDQLSSVESGAVLADCIKALPGNVVELQKSYRFDAELASFSASVNNGDAESVWNMLEGNRIVSLKLAADDWLGQIVECYTPYLGKVQNLSSIESYPEAFTIFNKFRVLCAVKNGRKGVSGINNQVELLFDQGGFPCGNREWYPGRPVMITRNDYVLGLFNGDIGLCLPDPENNGELAIWFEQIDGGLRRYSPARLPGCETVWAMTIHKSQGSEFDDVVIVLPEQDNQVLCRELFYTAVTRARHKVSVVVNKEICSITVSRQTKRLSGLADRLAPHFHK
jgi:exodeoxyribonuclease V alpha subunit